MTTTQYVLRYGLAGLLALTGIAKLLDVPEFVQVLSIYQALPPWALRPVALMCGLVELRPAEWLASEQRLPQAALASLPREKERVPWVQGRAAVVPYTTVTHPRCSSRRLWCRV